MKEKRKENRLLLFCFCSLFFLSFFFFPFSPSLFNETTNYNTKRNKWKKDEMRKGLKTFVLFLFFLFVFLLFSFFVFLFFFFSVLLLFSIPLLDRVAPSPWFFYFSPLPHYFLLGWDQDGSLWPFGFLCWAGQVTQIDPIHWSFHDPFYLLLFTFLQPVQVDGQCTNCYSYWEPLMACSQYDWSWGGS